MRKGIDRKQGLPRHQQASVLARCDRPDLGRSVSESPVDECECVWVERDFRCLREELHQEELERDRCAGPLREDFLMTAAECRQPFEGVRRRKAQEQQGKGVHTRQGGRGGSGGDARGGSTDCYASAVSSGVSP